MEIRTLTTCDLDTAASLLEAAYGRPDVWRSDLARHLVLTPDSWFLAEENGEPIGIGGATPYGPFAWIGLMAVHPNSQRHGVGRAILDHVLECLVAIGNPVAVLDASAAGKQLYRHRGFHSDDTTDLYELDHVVEPSRSDALLLGPNDLPALASFDAAIFGADRMFVLRSLFGDYPRRTFVTRHGTQITGYAVAQERRIGPLIAMNRKDADTLLHAALQLPFERPPTVLAPHANPDAQPLLNQHGFVLRRRLSHMYLGPSPPAQDRSHIYGQASFSLG